MSNYKIFLTSGHEHRIENVSLNKEEKRSGWVYQFRDSRGDLWGEFNKENVAGWFKEVASK